MTLEDLIFIGAAGLLAVAIVEAGRYVTRRSSDPAKTTAPTIEAHLEEDEAILIAAGEKFVHVPVELLKSLIGDEGSPQPLWAVPAEKLEQWFGLRTHPASTHTATLNPALQPQLAPAQPVPDAQEAAHE